MSKLKSIKSIYLQLSVIMLLLFSACGVPQNVQPLSPSETTDTLTPSDITGIPETNEPTKEPDTPETPSETPSEPVQITGVVTDATMNTIEIESDGKIYYFDKTEAEITGDGFLIGDTVSVTYNQDTSQIATCIELIKEGENHNVKPLAYEVKGTADSITGKSWDNMLAQRQESTDFANAYPDDVFVNENPDENVVYLTFDDGPDSENTLLVMNTLKEYGVSGTFFFTGENMKIYKDVVTQVFDNGFAIGLHGNDHTSLKSLSKDDIEKQLQDANDELESITGTRTAIMRPPYGDLTDSTIESISSLNYKIYLWSIDTLDWAQSDSAEVLRNIKENLRPGDIILMHTAAGNNLSASILSEIIEYIQSQGYEMAALPNAE